MLCGPVRILPYRIFWEATPCAPRNFVTDSKVLSGLLVHDADRRVETIELADTVRRWRVYIIRAASRSTEPFRVSAQTFAHFFRRCQLN